MINFIILVVRLLIISYLLIGINFSASLAKNKVKEIQEIYFYAKKYYVEGKYEKSIEEFEKILSLSPGHSESLKMIYRCKNKINLTRSLIDQALKDYRKGSMLDALEKVKMAYQKDKNNYQVKSLISKISMDVGIEYSIVGDHKKAIKYFENAQRLFLGDKKIQKLVQASKSMLANNITENREPTTVETKKLKDMISIFEKYQKNQNNLLLTYAKSQKDIQKIIENSEKEKKKLYSLLKEREEMIDRMLDREEKQSEKIFHLIKTNLPIAGIIIVLMAFMFLLFLRGQIKKKNLIYESQKKFQNKLVESFEKSSRPSMSQLSENEKKLKKLEIIERELSGEDFYENKIALNLLQNFFNDKEYKIQLRAVKVLYRFAPRKSINILEKIIKKEKSEIRNSACMLLGEMVSVESIELLLKLIESQDDEIKKITISSLLKISKKHDISDELRNKIKSKIDKVHNQENWVVV